MLTVKSCCCVFSLKTGSLILICISLATYLFGISNGIREVSDSNVDFSRIWEYIYACGGVIIISLAGIYGIFKEKPVLLIPYLVFKAISLIALMILLVVWPFVGAAVLKRQEGPNAQVESAVFIIEIIFIIVAGFCCYFFVVVLSYYNELTERNQNQVDQQRRQNV